MVVVRVIIKYTVWGPLHAKRPMFLFIFYAVCVHSQCPLINDGGQRVKNTNVKRPFRCVSHVSAG